MKIVSDTGGEDMSDSGCFEKFLIFGNVNYLSDQKKRRTVGILKKKKGWFKSNRRFFKICHF